MAQSTDGGELFEKYEFRQYPFNFPDNKMPGGQGSSSITMAAGAMVFAHNKILLVRSEMGDLWSVPGGVVRFNESPEETMVREVKEELNLDVEKMQSPPYLFHFSLETEGGEDKIFLVHFLVKVKDPVKILMGGDVSDYKWESIGSNFRDAYPNVKPAVDYFMNI